MNAVPNVYYWLITRTIANECYFIENTFFLTGNLSILVTNTTWKLIALRLNQRLWVMRTLLTWAYAEFYCKASFDPLWIIYIHNKIIVMAGFGWNKRIIPTHTRCLWNCFETKLLDESGVHNWVWCPNYKALWTVYCAPLTNTVQSELWLGCGLYNTVCWRVGTYSIVKDKERTAPLARVTTWIVSRTCFKMLVDVLPTRSIVPPLNNVPWLDCTHWTMVLTSRVRWRKRYLSGSSFTNQVMTGDVCIENMTHTAIYFVPHCPQSILQKLLASNSWQQVTTVVK